MREILFRAQKIDTKEWVYGHYTYMYSKDKHFIYAGSKWYEVLKDTLCQYTGLTDKNGRKIFESDILSIDGSEYGLWVGMVEFQWQCLTAKFEYYRHRLENCPEKYEVIGNIYENSELMEV